MSDWRSLPFAPSPGSYLCRASDIPEGQGKEVVFGEGKDAFRVVVFRVGDKLLAYHNCCPHFSIPLNYEPDKFHTFDSELLMCAHHIAMFRLEDGYCYEGPCQGSRLTAIPTQLHEGELTVG
jgi:nitrite reductase/ring-hydroxylating ferredoxin subunit